MNDNAIYRSTTMPPKVCKKKIKSVRPSVRPGLARNLFFTIPFEMDRMALKRQTSMEVASEDTPFLSVAQDNMDDIELRNIQLQIPTGRYFGKPPCVEVRVRTDCGDILVAVQGHRSKPAICTYHDLGLNYSSFQPFFNYVDMRALLENFCVYHITAPGQEEGALTLPDDYVYPSMDRLANQLNYVLSHFGIKSFIGFGVGAGANVLARFALAHPQKVDALALINCTSTSPGWTEWAYQRMNTRSLRNRGMISSVLNYLLWHHFGRCPEERNYDLVQMYRSQFEKNVNPVNLSMFIDSYVERSDLGIHRDAGTIKVPVLNITGAMSPHVDDTVVFNGRLNPGNSTWMKISDCGLVLEEQPGKVSEAFRLFLQGEGYVAPLSPTKIVAFRRLSDAGQVGTLGLMGTLGRMGTLGPMGSLGPMGTLDAERRRSCRHSPVIRITENPISEAVVC